MEEHFVYQRPFKYPIETIEDFSYSSRVRCRRFKTAGKSEASQLSKRAECLQGELGYKSRRHRSANTAQISQCRTLPRRSHNPSRKRNDRREGESQCDKLVKRATRLHDPRFIFGGFPALTFISNEAVHSISLQPSNSLVEQFEHSWLPYRPRIHMGPWGIWFPIPLPVMLQAKRRLRHCLARSPDWGLALETG